MRPEILKFAEDTNLTCFHLLKNKIPKTEKDHQQIVDSVSRLLTDAKDRKLKIRLQIIYALVLMRSINFRLDFIDVESPDEFSSESNKLGKIGKDLASVKRTVEQVSIDEVSDLIPIVISELTESYNKFHEIFGILQWNHALRFVAEKFDLRSVEVVALKNAIDFLHSSREHYSAINDQDALKDVAEIDARLSQYYERIGNLIFDIIDTFLNETDPLLTAVKCFLLALQFSSGRTAVEIISMELKLASIYQKIALNSSELCDVENFFVKLLEHCGKISAKRGLTVVQQLQLAIYQFTASSILQNFEASDKHAAVITNLFSFRDEAHQFAKLDAANAQTYLASRTEAETAPTLQKKSSKKRSLHNEEESTPMFFKPRFEKKRAVAVTTDAANTTTSLSNGK